ncbi:hypothetical protein QBC46DRAFT_427149 [Diplogelasinospora grovesii]|uniref:Uncharacterized protein n=1 Tax=Diplogelasinospora grovesii TaxID=303347 RepID=A0AAN6RYF5_9PEZI|nr:hypothetical protein QBC46DRAFT_427149 [Diplogelasinospora grovesii]
MSTCGYLNGDASVSWVAPAGYDCRVDTLYGIWGFCPTTIAAVSDCGLGGYCFDSFSCTLGCGSLSSSYCTMAFLAFGVDQTYEYFYYGGNPGTQFYLAEPTAAFITPSPSSTSPLPSSSPLLLPISSSPTSLSSTSSNSNTGVIIGGVVGGLALLCVTGIAMVYFLTKYRSSKKSSHQGA